MGCTFNTEVEWFSNTGRMLVTPSRLDIYPSQGVTFVWAVVEGAALLIPAVSNMKEVY